MRKMKATEVGETLKTKLKTTHKRFLMSKILHLIVMKHLPKLRLQKFQMCFLAKNPMMEQKIQGMEVRKRGLEKETEKCNRAKKIKVPM